MSDQPSSKPGKLITFPPSSNSENCRWMMLRYGQDFIESAHPPPFLFFILFVIGSKSFPVFIKKSEKIKLKSTEDIFAYFDPLQTENHQMIPAEHKKEILEAWDLYNIKMGNQTVMWAYGHLLPHKSIMTRPLSLGAPWYEVFATKHLYFIPKNLLLYLVKPTSEKMSLALKSVQGTFKSVSDLLADGRQYLIGNRFTLADMAFAVAGAPFVLPMGYGGKPDQPGPIPTYDQWPDDLKAVIDEMRQTEAGKFILRMYKDERYVTP